MGLYDSYSSLILLVSFVIKGEVSIRHNLNQFCNPLDC